MMLIHVVMELLSHLNAETEGMVLDFGAPSSFRRESSFSLDVTPTTTMTSKENNPPLSSKIDGILAKEPSKECIYQLLKLSTPTLTESDLLDESSRNAAMATLIHEVSAMDRKEASQARVSKVTTFIDRCSKSLETKKPATGKRKANPNSPPSSPLSSFPENFHVHDKWPFLNVDTIHPTHYTINVSMEALAATHCIDARGTIAHQRQVETPISFKDSNPGFFSGASV